MSNHKMNATAHNFIDIGVNLTNKRFNDDIEQVVERAKANGVSHQIVTGTNLESSLAALNLCRNYPGYLTATAGFHPHQASENNPESWWQLTQLWHNPEVVAIGETGLDYKRNFSTPQQQLDSFEKHLQAACEVNLPLFLHQRDGHDDFYELLSHYRNKLLVGAVLHCFTGSPQWLQRLMKLNIYFGVTGWVCDDNRGEDLRNALPLIPQDRLLIETDAPYLMPKTLPSRPKSSRNEPSYLAHVAGKVAQLRGVSVAEIGKITTNNARRLFAFTGYE